MCVYLIAILSSIFCTENSFGGGQPYYMYIGFEYTVVLGSHPFNEQKIWLDLEGDVILLKI